MPGWPKICGDTIDDAGTASPSMMRLTMASRFSDLLIAARTRASLNGFLPSGLPALSVTKGGLSRDWSICQKMVRHDTCCSILNFGFCFSLATSADGTLSITSTSPASSADERAPLSVMMRKMARSHSGLGPQ
ncbi:hypothetical protein D3C72_1556710 [compost metagenome]